jgi:hypothetical protein
MPYLRGDADAYREIVSETGEENLTPGFSEDFQYQASTARFKQSELTSVAQTSLEALLALGATQFRVRYDGGFDEGFAHSEYVILGERHRRATDVADKLAKTEFVTRVRSAAAHRKYGLFAADLADKLVARYAIDELAHELASKLLGEGYGTGEYQLYGAFTAELQTGEINDDPAAQKPRNME